MTTRLFTEQEAELLRRVREAVKAIEPDAQIILYGSRARGDAEPDSDWDLLVILDGRVDGRRASSVRHAIYAVEREVGEVFATMVRSRDKWESDLYRAMPFHVSVEREGVPV